MKGRLILYDTCNFRNYPIGGQITSIKNFLKYVSLNYPKYLKNILLVGVSIDEQEVGKIIPIQLGDVTIDFLAVALATTNLSKVRSSLRLEYVKGLFKYRHLISITKEDCNYIHTPEAFGVIKFMCRKSSCYIFSHGSYLDMWKRVRFFKNQPLIRKSFQKYLTVVIKKCNGIFVLDERTFEDYIKYNSKVHQVGNSIVCQDYFERSLDITCIKFLFAGRLSEGKNIGDIIKSIKTYNKNVNLTILGDGEKYDELNMLSNERIKFVGAVSPENVEKYMRDADILIMNSEYEGIPMTILEGISLGLPVITTDVGGIREVLNYGKDSEITDGSIKSIHTAMDKIIDDYGNYTINAYNNSKRFDYKIINEKIFEVINQKLKWEYINK